MKKKLTYFLSIIIISFLFSCDFLLDFFGENSAYDLEAHYLDVGQADSIYIKLPNQKHMLIDAGNNGDGDFIVKYLEEHDVDTIHYLVGTHLHEDHIGGLDDVINNFNIISLYLPNDTSTTKTYEDVLMAIYEKDLTIKHSKKGIVIFNDTINGKLLKAEMLSPIQNSYSNANDYSPVIKLTYDEATFLFTGDAEKLVEDELLDDDVDLRADVLKVGHHGSSSSSSAAFVQAVSPKISIISVGKDNKYGHPSDAVIKRLISNGSLVYRTDKDGTIVVKSNGNIYDVLTNDNTLTYHNNYGETLVVNDEKRKYLGWIYVG